MCLGIRCRPCDKVWTVGVVTRPPGIEELFVGDVIRGRCRRVAEGNVLKEAEEWRASMGTCEKAMCVYVLLEAMCVEAMCVVLEGSLQNEERVWQRAGGNVCVGHVCRPEGVL